MYWEKNNNIGNGVSLWICGGQGVAEGHFSMVGVGSPLPDRGGGTEDVSEAEAACHCVHTYPHGGWLTHDNSQLIHRDGGRGYAEVTVAERAWRMFTTFRLRCASTSSCSVILTQFLITVE